MNGINPSILRSARQKQIDVDLNQVKEAPKRFATRLISKSAFSRKSGARLHNQDGEEKRLHEKGIVEVFDDEEA